MFFRRRFRNNSKDGIIIVSISNLFHILDLSRKQSKEDSNIIKPNTHTFSSDIKEKETFKSNKTIGNEMDTETRQNEKEIRTEESKEFIIENKNEIKGFKNNKSGNLRRTQTNNKSKKGICSF